MRQKTIKTGDKFGRLVVLREVGKYKCGHILWRCICICGNFVTVSTQNLKTGKCPSCGCFVKDMIAQRNYKHGHAIKGKVTSAYNIWRSMMKRCYNPNHKNYPRYGGRGIRVCDRWHDFQNFYADMGDCPKGLSIERIDNDGHYILLNCKWGTDEEQANNKSNTYYLELNKEKLSMSQWSRRVHIDVSTLRRRKTLGWSDEETLTTPVGAKRKRS